MLRGADDRRLSAFGDVNRRKKAGMRGQFFCLFHYEVRVGSHEL